MFKLTNPSNHIFISQRNNLLQQTLREQNSPIRIEKEYPIVLSHEHINLSYCLIENNQILAHANLWPRVVHDHSSISDYRIGLIGNVATQKALQGRGYCRRIMSELEEVAVNRDLAALILWSDLPELYHKLGFASVGKEYHFYFYNRQSPKLTDLVLRSLPSASIDSDLISNLQRLRYQVPSTVVRTIEEYMILSTIPLMDLYLGYEGSELRAYAWIGKGIDMVGVMHEWGASNPDFLVDLALSISEKAGLDQIMILAPGSLRSEWLQTLQEECDSFQESHMAFGKIIKKEYSERIEDIFIWGLDSI